MSYAAGSCAVPFGLFGMHKKNKLNPRLKGRNILAKASFNRSKAFVANCTHGLIVKGLHFLFNHNRESEGCKDNHELNKD